MLFRGVQYKISARLDLVFCEAHMRGRVPDWIRIQTPAIERLGIVHYVLEDFNNDKPCKYARSRME